VPKLVASIKGAPGGGWRWPIAGFVLGAGRGVESLGIGFHL
jgi:hypothetical protein